MAPVQNKPIIPVERIATKIYLIRDQKVMLDSDLAALYEVPTKRLNERVKRNIKRFPEDFMFQLTTQEFEHLRSQIATSSWGGRRTPPYAFTEQGVAMLSGVLNSDRAIDVNVAIIRTFVHLRNVLATHDDVVRKIQEHDRQIASLYEYVENLLKRPDTTSKPIGYIWPKDQ